MSAWMLPSEAFAFLRHRLPRPSARIVELGSGDGTKLLREMGEVWSVEHDEAWLCPAPGSHFIHAPIVDGWYDPAPIKALPESYDCLVIDGPPGTIGRGGLLAHLDLFQRVPLLVDDVNREAEFDLARQLAIKRQQPVSIHHLVSGRAFATIGWEVM